ncbi:unnamed protein product, partial [marine sediment metagenome]
IAKAKTETPILYGAAPIKDDKGNITGAVLVFRDITQYKEAEKKIEAYQNRLRWLVSQLTCLEERERRHIATELRDSIGQLLVFCKIKLGELGEARGPLESSPLLEKIRGVLDRTIHYTRSLSWQVGPPLLYELGLREALEWLVESLYRQHNIQINLQVDSQVRVVDEKLRIFLFRAVQQLLVNVVRHANTDRVKVSVRRENESVHITVEDRGVGFNTATIEAPLNKNRRFGLFNVREHINYFGG